ncbi:ubiquitin-conjugating enzyme E2 J2 isoform X4 [Callithrix jacchus]|uniref:ubiquitin-conjugating enzyme E2 J2 isoform X4 n=1 Tax=Callithrix jacchus TaxID=9483 RepID=UPI00159D0BCA|nr:ubiquitin-conjugating enzyme E2 J2 isoform X4 [Callithrix jacchus]
MAVLQMSSTSTKRAPTTATQRLKQDYLRIKKDPVPYICAEPLPSNILECKPCCQVVAAGLDGSVRPVPQEPLARPARCLSLPERRVLFPKRPVGALRTTWIPCYLSHRKAAGLCLRKRTTSSCVPSFHGLGTVTKQDHIPGHYVVRGPEMTPYEGGYYHGKLIFPREFPFKPPSIYMITPNGRFKCNTRLCLSITDFHPDTWNPAWSVSTILTGLLSFMVEKGPTLGSIETSDFTAGLGGVPALTPAPSWRLLCFGLPRHTQPRVPLCLSVSLLSESSLIHTHQGLRLGILGKDSWQHRVQRLI